MPACPLLMAARAALPLREGVADWGVLPSGEEVSGFVEAQREPMFDDPSRAPGVACIGSRCMAWMTYADSALGTCMTYSGQRIPDPAVASRTE